VKPAGSASVTWTVVAAAVPVLVYESVTVIGPAGDGPLLADSALVTPMTEFATAVVSVLVAVVGVVSVADTVMVAVRVPEERGGRSQTVKEFRTFTGELFRLRDWLVETGVTVVVMEATGQYWKPIWYLLEERGFDLKLVNARHVKMVPGRKTDLADAAWLAQLLEHGLLRSSFVPPPAIRDLRELVRHRRTLIETRTAVRNRVLKLLGSCGMGVVFMVVPRRMGLVVSLKVIHGRLAELHGFVERDRRDVAAC